MKKRLLEWILRVLEFIVYIKLTQTNDLLSRPLAMVISFLELVFLITYFVEICIR